MKKLLSTPEYSLEGGSFWFQRYQVKGAGGFIGKRLIAV
jgi:hypothetical protein